MSCCALKRDLVRDIVCCNEVSDHDHLSFPFNHERKNIHVIGPSFVDCARFVSDFYKSIHFCEFLPDELSILDDSDNLMEICDDYPIFHVGNNLHFRIGRPHCDFDEDERVAQMLTIFSRRIPSHSVVGNNNRHGLMHYFNVLKSSGKNLKDKLNNFVPAAINSANNLLSNHNGTILNNFLSGSNSHQSASSSIGIRGSSNMTRLMGGVSSVEIDASNFPLDEERSAHLVIFVFNPVERLTKNIFDEVELFLNYNKKVVNSSATNIQNSTFPNLTNTIPISSIPPANSSFSPTNPKLSMTDSSASFSDSYFSLTVPLPLRQDSFNGSSSCTSSQVAQSDNVTLRTPILDFYRSLMASLSKNRLPFKIVLSHSTKQTPPSPVVLAKLSHDLCAALKISPSNGSPLLTGNQNDPPSQVQPHFGPLLNQSNASVGQVPPNGDGRYITSPGSHYSVSPINRLISQTKQILSPIAAPFSPLQNVVSPQHNKSSTCPVPPVKGGGAISQDRARIESAKPQSKTRHLKIGSTSTINRNNETTNDFTAPWGPSFLDLTSDDTPDCIWSVVNRSDFLASSIRPPTSSPSMSPPASPVNRPKGSMKDGSGIVVSSPCPANSGIQKPQPLIGDILSNSSSSSMSVTFTNSIHSSKIKNDILSSSKPKHINNNSIAPSFSEGVSSSSTSAFYNQLSTLSQINNSEVSNLDLETSVDPVPTSKCFSIEPPACPIVNDDAFPCMVQYLPPLHFAPRTKNDWSTRLPCSAAELANGSRYTFETSHTSVPLLTFPVNFFQNFDFLGHSTEAFKLARSLETNQMHASQFAPRRLPQLLTPDRWLVYPGRSRFSSFDSDSDGSSLLNPQMFTCRLHTPPQEHEAHASNFLMTTPSRQNHAHDSVLVTRQVGSIYQNLDPKNINPTTKNNSKSIVGQVNAIDNSRSHVTSLLKDDPQLLSTGNFGNTEGVSLSARISSMDDDDIDDNICEWTKCVPEQQVESKHSVENIQCNSLLQDTNGDFKTEEDDSEYSSSILGYFESIDPWIQSMICLSREKQKETTEKEIKNVSNVDRYLADNFSISKQPTSYFLDEETHLRFLFVMRSLIVNEKSSTILQDSNTQPQQQQLSNVNELEGHFTSTKVVDNHHLSLSTISTHITSNISNSHGNLFNSSNSSITSAKDSSKYNNAFKNENTSSTCRNQAEVFDRALLKKHHHQQTTTDINSMDQKVIFSPDTTQRITGTKMYPNNHCKSYITRSPSGAVRNPNSEDYLTTMQPISASFYSDVRTTKTQENNEISIRNKMEGGSFTQSSQLFGENQRRKALFDSIPTSFKVDQLRGSSHMDSCDVGGDFNECYGSSKPHVSSFSESISHKLSHFSNQSHNENRRKHSLNEKNAGLNSQTHTFSKNLDGNRLSRIPEEQQSISRNFDVNSSRHHSVVDRPKVRAAEGMDHLYHESKSCLFPTSHFPSKTQLFPYSSSQNSHLSSTKSYKNNLSPSTHEKITRQSRTRLSSNSYSEENSKQHYQK